MILTTSYMYSQSDSQSGLEIYDMIKNRPALSPEAASFARYGQIPVGHFTGTPQISIPIYTIDANTFKIPITLSYHASGVKVDDESGWVGLGWTLNAGGCITRQVNDVPDEEFIRESVRPPYPYGTNLDDVSANNFNSLWDIAYGDPLSKSDCQYDQYNFNFLGLSGSFIMKNEKENGRKQGVCYSLDGIKIVMELENNQIPIRFQIYKDGYVYEFEDVEYTNTFVKSYATDNRSSSFSSWKQGPSYSSWSVPIATAWYLTKITTPTNQMISYKYKKVPEVKVKNISFNETFGNKFSSLNQSVYRVYRNATVSETTILNQVYLSEIQFKGGRAVFNSSSGRKDNKNGFKLDNVEIYNNLNTVVNRAKFNYDYFPNDNVFNNFLSTEEELYRLRLSDVEIQDAKYIFNYNEIPLPARNTFSKDWEGYFNGKKNNILLPGIVFGNETIGNPSVSREPDETTMQAGILTKITYPTGGYTRFEYEAHKVREFLSDPLRTLGGLRIKKIQSYSRSNEYLEGKLYQYGFSKEGNGVENIYARKSVIPAYEVYIEKKNPGGLASILETRVSQMTKYYDYLQKSPYSTSVCYPDVYESIIDEQGNALGATYYNYSYEKDDVFLPDKTNPIFTNKGALRGNLLKMEIYDNDNNLKYQKSTTYNSIVNEVLYGFYVDAPYTKMPAFRPIQPEEEKVYFKGRCGWFPYESRFNKISLEKETTFENGIATNVIKEYKYDTSLPINFTKPSQVIMTSSKGDRIINTYQYMTSGQLNDAYIWNRLEARNYRPITEEIKYVDGTLVNQTKYQYTYFNDAYLLSNIQERKSDQSGDWIQVFSVLKFDIFNNPSNISFKGNYKICYIWGYNGQYPLAEIKYSSSINEIEGILGKELIQRVLTAPSPSSADMQKINDLRQTMPTSDITTYNYNPLIGVTSVTNPSGKVTNYYYDSNNRLKEISIIEDGKTNILEQYYYHYYNKN